MEDTKQQPTSSIDSDIDMDINMNIQIQHNNLKDRRERIAQIRKERQAIYEVFKPKDKKLLDDIYAINDAFRDSLNAKSKFD